MVDSVFNFLEIYRFYVTTWVWYCFCRKSKAKLFKGQIGFCIPVREYHLTAPRKMLVMPMSAGKMLANIS